MARRFSTLALLATLTMSGASQAHQIWLEQTPDTAKMYFGEFDRNLRETSPGVLDKLPAPSAKLSDAQGDRPLSLSKTANAFTLSERAARDQTLYVEESTIPVVEYKVGGVPTRAAKTLAARLATSSTALPPKLTLDVVPNGKTGEFKVYYKGEPQPKTRVGIIVQSGWAREARTDDMGVVKFDLPWQGRYVLEVRYADKTPGERGGKPYDMLNYMTTLSIMQTDGLKAVPALAPAVPNK